MQYSDYLKYIFCKADSLCDEYGIKYRAIESIYITMLCEYESEYETNDPPITFGNSIEYEREKAEYIIQQCHSDVKSRYMSILLKRRTDCISKTEVMFDALSDAEDIARLRNQTVLSADIMLVAILPSENLIFVCKANKAFNEQDIPTAYQYLIQINSKVLPGDYFDIFSEFQEKSQMNMNNILSKSKTSNCSS